MPTHGDNHLGRRPVTQAGARKTIDAVRQSLHKEEGTEQKETPSKKRKLDDKLADELTREGPLTRSRDAEQKELLDKLVKRSKGTSRSREGNISQGELMQILRLEADRPLQWARISEIAKPVLPPEAKPLINQLKEVEKEIKKGRENPLTSDRYVELFGETLKASVPETWKYFQDHNVKLVPMENDDVWPPERQTGPKQWEVKIPTQYKEPLLIMMRLIEVPLKIEHVEQGNPSPQTRARVAASVHKLNESLLGEKLGFGIEGYGPAERYRGYYYGSLRKFFENGSIKCNSTESEINGIRERAHREAEQKLIEDLTAPMPDGTLVYPSFGPGSNFWERQAAKTEENMRQKAVKAGTQEFDNLIEALMDRPDIEDHRVLSTIITREKAILAQPHVIRLANPDANPPQLEDFRNNCPHQVMAKSESLPWSGETKCTIRKNADGTITKRLDWLCPKSGHYRTDNNEFALEVFREHGFDTSETKIWNVTAAGTYTQVDQAPG